MKLSSTQLRGHAAMIGANTIWGVMAPITKMVLAAGIVSPILMTNFRMVGAAVLFWIASLFMPREHVCAKDKLLLVGAGLFGIVFNQGCYVFGISFTAPGEASIVTTTMPLWVMFLAAVVLKEPITVKKIAGIVLGASGAILLVLGSWGKGGIVKGDNPVLGDILVLTAQLSYAIYLTFYKNFIQKYSIITLMKWMFTFASIVVLPVCIPTALSTDWPAMTWDQWAGVGYVVFFATFLAYICTLTGQKALRPTVVGMYNYVQPVVATCLGVYLGLDKFTVVKVVAVALIFTGVYLVTVSKARVNQA